MPLTREFKETVQTRLRADRKYRKELLKEGVECLLAGDLETGKAILRDYINATIGFVRAGPPDETACEESDANARSKRQSAGA